jgi:hypothetical protein
VEARKLNKMTKNRYAAGAFILTLFCFGILQAQDRVPASSNEAKPVSSKEAQVDTCDWSAAENGFAAGLCLSPNRTIIEQWEDPPDSLIVASAGEAIRGIPLHVMVFAYLPVEGGNSGKLIEYEITVVDPQGDIFSELKDGKGLKTYKTIKNGVFGIGAIPFSITLNDSDMSGLYTVNVLVRA